MPRDLKASVSNILRAPSPSLLKVVSYFIAHGADPQLWNWFTAVDTDHSGQLSVDELQRALVNGDWSPFNIETVRTMVNMFDKGIA
jgi:Ca2+-binding EF-hand superfamily protein